MLGVWGAHGLDAIVRDAWARGVVLCGLSAGSLCWFAQGGSAFRVEAAGEDVIETELAVRFLCEPVLTSVAA
jgi:hypothetical protein